MNNFITIYDEVKVALNYLKQLLPVTREHKQVVCHGDLNHNNLIQTNEGQLYLVDWENATIADPITDFGMVLKWYIPKKDCDSRSEERRVVTIERYRE